MGAGPEATPAVYFDRMQHDHARLRDEVEFALRAAVEREGIKTHSISARVKEKQSYLEKISRKGYKDPLREVDDIVGVRVVCLFTADLPKLRRLVHEVFAVLVEEDKVEGGAADSFGYMSVHYVCNLHPDNAGPRYIGLSGLRFEVQCRTILMDAWANVSHYLAYKGEASIPEPLRKDFHALAGLFYVADKHFELFFHETEESKAAAVNAAAHAHKAEGQSTPINRDTLLALLSVVYPDREAPELEEASELAQEVALAKYETVEQVEADLKAAAQAALAYEKDHPPFVNDDETGPFAAVGLARQALAIANKKFAAVKYGAPVGGDLEYEFDSYRKLIAR